MKNSVAALAIIASFAIGTIVTGSTVYAADKPNGQPFDAVWNSIGILQTQTEYLGELFVQTQDDIDFVDGKVTELDTRVSELETWKTAAHQVIVDNRATSESNENWLNGVDDDLYDNALPRISALEDEINSQSQGNLSELIADVEKLKQFHISQNNPPLVDAGADISGFFVGQTNQLSGWTIDPDSEITSIEWTQISGSPATIDDADTLTPYITPSQPDEILIFQLEVVDEWGGIGTDEVNVTVEP